MSDSARMRNDGRLVFGLVVITAGVLFTLDNLGMVDAWEYLRWWPLLIIGAGVVRIFRSREAASVMGGLVTIAVGVLLLDLTANVLPGRVWSYWPVLLILGGAGMVFKAWRGPGAGAGTPADVTSTFNAFALMSGVDRKFTSQTFRGGDATAIMGGCEIDLRQARIANGPAVVDVFAFWGGIDLFIPSDWVVRNEAVAIMGAVDDSRKAVGTEATAGGAVGGMVAKGSDAVNATDPNRVLILRGGALMGGIELKS